MEGFCYLQQCYREGSLLSAPSSSSRGWFCWCVLILESITPLIPEEFTLRIMRIRAELLCLGVLCYRHRGRSCRGRLWGSRQAGSTGSCAGPWFCRSLAPLSLARAPAGSRARWAGSINQRMAEPWLSARSGKQQCLGMQKWCLEGGTGPYPEQQQEPLTWGQTALQQRFTQQRGQTGLH